KGRKANPMSGSPKSFKLRKRYRVAAPWTVTPALERHTVAHSLKPRAAKENFVKKTFCARNHLDGSAFRVRQKTLGGRRWPHITCLRGTLGKAAIGKQIRGRKMQCIV